MKTPKEQAESLLNDLMAFAETMLEEHGEFFPFAGLVDTSGENRHLGARDGKEQPPPDEIRELLIAGLRERATRGECQLAVLITNVSVTDAETDQVLDAVHAAVEHRDGYFIDVFFPYTISDGNLQYGETVAQPRTPEFFVDATDESVQETADEGTAH